MSHFIPDIELSVHDMEWIEDALHAAEQKLSMPGGEQGHLRDMTGSMRAIDDLLGCLHSQKLFFRPINKSYVGG